MTTFEPKFEEDTSFVNKNTNEEFTIIGMKYDKTLCDIVYKVRHIRFKFDMRKIPERVIIANLESGDYEKE